jgi:hypothetical protein
MYQAGRYPLGRLRNTFELRTAAREHSRRTRRAAQDLAVEAGVYPTRYCKLLNRGLVADTNANRASLEAIARTVNYPVERLFTEAYPEYDGSPLRTAAEAGAPILVGLELRAAPSASERDIAELRTAFARLDPKDTHAILKMSEKLAALMGELRTAIEQAKELRGERV